MISLPGSGLRPSLDRHLPQILAPRQRNARRRRGGLDTRAPPPGARRGDRRTPRRAARIDRPRQRDLHRQHTVGAEAGVDAQQPDERLDQQRRADEEHGRQRDFDDDERVARAMGTAAADGAARRLRADPRRDRRVPPAAPGTMPNTMPVKTDIARREDHHAPVERRAGERRQIDRQHQRAAREAPTSR